MEGLILTVEQLKAEVDYFMQQDAFAWDTETMDGERPGTRGFPTQNTVVWISMATYGRTIVIPIGHPNGDVMLQKEHTKNKVFYPLIYDAPPEQLRPSVVFEILRPLFFNPNITKVAHNATFDFISVAKYFGAIPVGPMGDTIVQQWLLDENIGEPAAGPKRPLGKGLKILTKWYYGVDYDKEEVGKCVEKHAFSKVARYALLDARYAWLMYLKLTGKLVSEGLVPILELERDVTDVCCAMGLVGAPVDVQAIEELREILTAKLEILEAKVYRAAGRVFNINSPIQKQDVLYGLKKDGGQGLKPLKKSKKTGAPSTDQESLKKYERNAVVDALLEYAEYSKVLSTYVLSYLGEEGNAKKPCRIFNGRIHTDLVQYGTVTGRFSSREPNLQNIPAPRTDLGKQIRGLFRAPQGYKLLVADYGQMELRIMAHYIGYGGLYDGFLAGIDAHTQTAALVYGKTEELKNDPQYFDHPENKWMRSAAKTLNFAIVYGAQAEKVAKTLEIPVEEAEKLLADHHKAFPEIYKFKEQVIKAASGRTIPHIFTILGRKRRVYELAKIWADREAPKLSWYDPQRHWQAVKSVQRRGERQIINSLIQGSLGDMIKLAMVRMHALLQADAKLNPGREIHMILSVHDELVLLCPEDRTAEGSAMLLEAMTGKEMQDILSVPLDVGKVAVVQKWSQAK